jgi:hypothetical protein
LGEGNIHGLAFIHAHIKLILYFLWALLGANAAADALVFINVPGSLEDFDLKVARISGDALYFGERDKVNVGVPADLDQLGGDNSHGTLIGGEGLIQLGHYPTDSWRPFHKVHIEARVGQIEGGLHSDNTTPCDQYGSDDVFTTCHIEPPISPALGPG